MRIESYVQLRGMVAVCSPQIQGQLADHAGEVRRYLGGAREAMILWLPTSSKLARALVSMICGSRKEGELLAVPQGEERGANWIHDTNAKT